MTNRDDWPRIQPTFRRLREARGLDSLAVEIGAGRTSVHRWAKGENVPDQRYFPRVVEFVERHTKSVPSGTGSGE